MKTIKNLKIKIFADGANKKEMLEMNQKKIIKGLTTNPSLMKKAGIKNYKDFAVDILQSIKTKPISFEVFSDNFNEMEKQALEIASWGKNVYVKIPITNTEKKSSSQLIKRLVKKQVKLNITAITNLEQVKATMSELDNSVPSIISVFAGRIADTGRDPIPIMTRCLQEVKKNSNAELLWASPRELINIFQANNIGRQIITITKNIINKFHLINYNLDQYSLDTVKDFYKDAAEANYKI